MRPVVRGRSLAMHLEAFELMLPGMWVMALSPAAAAAAVERALEILVSIV